jgi:hypothetical protein
MSEDGTTAPVGAQGSTESGSGEGQSVETEPTSTEGQTEGIAQEASGEPTGEGLFDGQTPEQLHKSYKELQSEFGKRNETLKQLEANIKAFDRFGGQEHMLKIANYLSSNPRFAQWIASEQQKNVLGVNESDMDEETKKAIGIVQNVAEKIADRKVREALKSEVAPIADNLREQMFDKAFNAMDKKYDNWREMQDEMADLSDEMPEKRRNNPSFDDIEGLYFEALRKTGKMDDYAAKMYERKLTDKKNKSVEKPEPKPGESAAGTAKTMAEAFALAKKQQG